LVKQQQQFTHLEEATALRLGRLLDRGNVQMGLSSSAQPTLTERPSATKIREEWIDPLGLAATCLA